MCFGVVGHWTCGCAVNVHGSESVNKQHNWKGSKNFGKD